MNKDTIYASLTKNQKTAISIIRVSGPQTKTILQNFLKKEVKAKEVNLRNIYDSNGEFIDQGLVLFFSKPHSPTGEDVAEFHVHGSISIIKKINTEVDRILENKQLAKKLNYSENYIKNLTKELFENKY